VKPWLVIAKRIIGLALLGCVAYLWAVLFML
jgi:hypothetical protein